VKALRARIEDVPLGLLFCDALVGCVDSKAARQRLNEIAWRINAPLIDTGVLGSQSLARLSIYAPAAEGPCLECAWDPGPHGEYALLEQEYLCGTAMERGFPTGATAALGALAASMAAIEIGKLLNGVPATSLAGRCVVFDAGHHKLQVTTERANPHCRSDHRIWQIEPWNCSIDKTTVDDALRALGTLKVQGHSFVTELACAHCGLRERTPRLNRPLARCSACGRRMASLGFGARPLLDCANASEFSHRTLAEIGLQAGDVVSSYGRHRMFTEAA
jgi:hypothetical protein